jgi:cytochrome c oxidase subunit IV
MAHDSHGHDHEHHHEHSLKPHVIVLITLITLTLVTYFTALIHFGSPWNDVIAFGIAMTKASLVLMIFMHAREGSKLIKLCAFGGFFWIFLFFAYLVGDVYTRDGQTMTEGWQPYPKRVTAPPSEHH